MSTKRIKLDNLEKEITINTRYPIYTIIFNSLCPNESDMDNNNETDT